MAVAMALGLLAGMAAAQTDCQVGDKPLRNLQPEKLTADEIMRRASVNEASFKSARAQYAYTQDVKVQTLRRGVLPTDLFPDGEFRQVSEVHYDPSGHRLEHVTFAPQPTLQGIWLSKEDLDDIEERIAFMLLPETLLEYQTHYLGEQQVDELDTYVFEVTPLNPQKNRRYFQGRVWIEMRDLAIVKSCGKTVPDEILPAKKKRGTENIHPTFAVYRERIDHQFWFPVYARSDDLLHFRARPVRIRETVRFMDYHKPGTKPARRSASSLQEAAH